jgi:hypothetical protein
VLGQQCVEVGDLRHGLAGFEVADARRVEDQVLEVLVFFQDRTDPGSLGGCPSTADSGGFDLPQLLRVGIDLWRWLCFGLSQSRQGEGGRNEKRACLDSHLLSPGE